MRIRIGAANDVYGDVVIVGGQLEVVPTTPGDGEIIGNLIDHYGESLAAEGVRLASITPKAILDAMLDRLPGYTWAKLIEL